MRHRERLRWLEVGEALERPAVVPRCVDYRAAPSAVMITLARSRAPEAAMARTALCPACRQEPSKKARFA